MFIAQTIDVGCPQLAMHSIRELGDTSSIHYATTLFSVGAAGEIFFFLFLYKNMNFFEIFSNFSNQKTKVKIPGKNELILRIIFFSIRLRNSSTNFPAFCRAWRSSKNKEGPRINSFRFDDGFVTEWENLDKWNFSFSFFLQFRTFLLTVRKLT